MRFIFIFNQFWPKVNKKKRMGIAEMFGKARLVEMSISPSDKLYNVWF